MNPKNLPPLRFRSATLTDVPALTQIKPTAALHRDRVRDAQSPTFEYLVLERDQEILDFACLVFARPALWSDAQDQSHLPQIVDLQISPAYRGQGYGTFFLRSLEQRAAGRGFQALFLAVDPLGNPRAEALYRRLGYQPLQPEPYLKHWAFIDSDGNLHAGRERIVDMVKSL